MNYRVIAEYPFDINTFQEIETRIVNSPGLSEYNGAGTDGILRDIEWCLNDEQLEVAEASLEILMTEIPGLDYNVLNDDREDDDGM